MAEALETSAGPDRVLALLVTGLFSTLLKEVFQRPRPYKAADRVVPLVKCRPRA